MHRYTLGFTAITGGIILLAIFSRVKPRKCPTYYPSSKRCILQIMCTKRQVFRCWKDMCTKRQVFRCWKIFTAMNNLALHSDYVILV